MAWCNFSPLPAIISYKSQGKLEQRFTVSFCTHGHGLNTINTGQNHLNWGESHCGSNLCFFDHHFNSHWYFFLFLIQNPLTPQKFQRGFSEVNTWRWYFRNKTWSLCLNKGESGVWVSSVNPSGSAAVTRIIYNKYHSWYKNHWSWVQYKTAPKLFLESQTIRKLWLPCSI